MKLPTRVATGAWALILLAGACSGGSSSSSKPSTAGSTTTAVENAVNPNAPEVSPAGDIPDNQQFVRYSPPSGAFSVKVPEGWARTEANGAVSFTDKLNNIRMETVAATAAPTAQSAEQNELPTIRAASKSFEPGKVATVTRRAGPAVLITYRAASSPDQVTGKVVLDDVERYEFWKDGNEVVLTLSGPKGADNVDPWRIVTDSFGWL